MSLLRSHEFDLTLQSASCNRLWSTLTWHSFCGGENGQAKTAILCHHRGYDSLVCVVTSEMQKFLECIMYLYVFIIWFSGRLAFSELAWSNSVKCVSDIGHIPGIYYISLSPPTNYDMSKWIKMTIIIIEPYSATCQCMFNCSAVQDPPAERRQSPAMQ